MNDNIDIKTICVFIAYHDLKTEARLQEMLCKYYGVGVRTQDFTNGLVEFHNSYDEYLNNVEKYIFTLDYENRIERLKSQINDRLLGVSNE